MDYRPSIAITMGEPAGIGPEVIVKALADPVLRHKAKYIIYGMNELLHYAADLAEFDVFWWRDQYAGRLRSYPHDVVVVDYDQFSILGSAIRSPSKIGGEASMRFCVDAIDADNGGAVLRDGFGDGAAQCAQRAGDHDDFSLQFHAFTHWKMRRSGGPGLPAGGQCSRL